MRQSYRLVVLSSVLLLALPFCAFAKNKRCPTILQKVAADAQMKMGQTLSCAELKEAALLLPVEAGSGGAEWAFSGEAKVRQELINGFGITVPQDIMPIGYVERTAPAGPSVVIVLGLRIPKRVYAFFVLRRLVPPIVRDELAEYIGEGATYDRIGFYVNVSRKEGGYPRTGKWLNMANGGVWGRHQPKPSGVRHCLPCRGWLCPREAPLCFSDFNANGPEEVHVTDDCRMGVCGVAMFEPDWRGKMRLIFNENMVGPEWKEREEGWVLVSKPVCEDGAFCPSRGESLGNPTCKRPAVFLMRRGGKRVEWSRDLTREYYPISRQLAPARCHIEGDSLLTYSPGRGFVLYRKR